MHLSVQLSKVENIFWLDPVIWSAGIHQFVGRKHTINLRKWPASHFWVDFYQICWPLAICLGMLRPVAWPGLSRTWQRCSLWPICGTRFKHYQVAKYPSCPKGQQNSPGGQLPTSYSKTRQKRQDIVPSVSWSFMTMINQTTLYFARATCCVEHTPCQNGKSHPLGSQVVSTRFDIYITTRANISVIDFS